MRLAISTTKKIIISAVVTILLLAAALLGFPFYSYKDHKVDSGEAYGFVIGETKSKTYERAFDLYAKGKYKVFEVGRGSSAVRHQLNDPAEALDSDHWQLVVDPDWWNNVIYLEFCDGILVQVWRFRMCCEAP